PDIQTHTEYLEDDWFTQGNTITGYIESIHFDNIEFTDGIRLDNSGTTLVDYSSRLTLTNLAAGEILVNVFDYNVHEWAIGATARIIGPDPIQLFFNGVLRDGVEYTIYGEEHFYNPNYNTAIVTINYIGTNDPPTVSGPITQTIGATVGLLSV